MPSPKKSLEPTLATRVRFVWSSGDAAQLNRSAS